MASLSSFTSSPSSYSQETLSPGSLHGMDCEAFQQFTPSQGASDFEGHVIYANHFHSQQLAELRVSVLDEDLLRPLMAHSSPVGLADNSLHLLMTPSDLDESGSKRVSSGFDFNPQFNQPLLSYPTPGSVSHFPARYLGSQITANPSQPEQFYPTPTSTPERVLASLPSHSAQDAKLRASPQPSLPLARATRPVRAAAAKRKVYYAASDDESDEYESAPEPSPEPAPKRRKAPSATRSSVTPQKFNGKRKSEKKLQKKNQKEAKVVWEEDKTADPSAPVHENGKIVDGCQWGVPVYAVCQVEGVRSIKWRCSRCSALLGRRPDLHRHWKSCVANAFFICDEVIRESVSLPHCRDFVVNHVAFVDEDGSVWPGCGTICSRQDAARRHIERRFRNGHCSLNKPNKGSFPTIAAYEQRLAVYNNMLVNSTWRAALPVSEKNRLAHSALSGMKTDIFKE